MNSRAFGRRSCAEARQGREPLVPERLQPGDSIGSIVRGPITISDIIVFLMGWGGQYIRSHGDWVAWAQRHPSGYLRNSQNIPDTIEAVHWDTELVQTVGVPAPYDYGPQRVAWAITLLTNWMGDAAWLSMLELSLRRHVVVGDTIWISGTVRDVVEETDGSQDQDRFKIDVDLSMRNRARRRRGTRRRNHSDNQDLTGGPPVVTRSTFGDSPSDVSGQLTRLDSPDSQAYPDGTVRLTLTAVTVRRRRVPPTENLEALTCSFCNKSQSEIAKLVAGPGVYICNECIGLCSPDIGPEELDRKPAGATEPDRCKLRSQDPPTIRLGRAIRGGSRDGVLHAPIAAHPGRPTGLWLSHIVLLRDRWQLGADRSTLGMTRRSAWAAVLRGG